MNLVALITLLVDHVLLEFEMVTVLARQTINHTLFKRDLLTHGALAFLGINALHHHFIRLLSYLLIVRIAASIHDGA